MVDQQDPSEILDLPRERHYLLGHEAFRQLCEHDAHQFFERIASDNQNEFIAELVKQVESFCPDDETILDTSLIKVIPSTIGNKPVIIIQMPPVKAYVECIYVGIVANIDIATPQSIANPEIKYFTLELGESDSGDCEMFCEWQGSTHYNLAEMEQKTSVADFLLVIKQRLGVKQ